MDTSTRVERKRIVGEYVRKRLVQECGAVYGKAYEISKKIGFSAAHVSNIQDGNRNVGDSFAMAMADYWGMTYSQLERLALEELALAHVRGSEDPKAGPGREATPPPLLRPEPTVDVLPNLTATVAFFRGNPYPRTFLEEYEQEARKQSLDRPKNVWQADLEVKFWEWRQNQKLSKDNSASRGLSTVKGDVPTATHEPTKGGATARRTNEEGSLRSKGARDEDSTTQQRSGVRGPKTAAGNAKGKKAG